MKVPDLDLDVIDAEHELVKEKAINMLSVWKKKTGKKATMKNLANALNSIGRPDLAGKLPRGNSRICTGIVVTYECKARQ